MNKIKSSKAKLNPVIYVILLLLILNSLFFVTKQFLFFPVKLLVIQVLTLIALTTFIISKKCKFSNQNKFLGILILIYLIFNIFRSFFSTSPLLANQYIIILIPGIILFFIFSNIKLAKIEKKFLSLAIILSFLLSIIPGILLQAKNRPAFSRLTLSWANANYLASFLLVVIPFILLQIFHSHRNKSKQKVKYFYYFILILSLGGLLWTQSRGAILSLAIITSIFLFIYLIKTGKTKILIASSVIFILIFSLIILGLTRYRPATIKYRQRVYKSSFKYLKANWLAGTGPGTFSKFYPKYRNPDYKLLHQEDIIPHAHNEFLQQFTELGVFGFILFCSTILIMVLKAIKKLSWDNDAPKDLFHLATFFAFLLLLIHNLVSITLRIQPIFIYLFILGGLLVNEDNKKSKTSFKIKYAFILFIPILVWQIYLTFHQIQGLTYLQKSKDAFRMKNDFKKSLVFGQKALKKIPRNTDLLYHLGYTNVSVKQYLDAEQYFNKLLAVSPYYPRVNFWKGYINSLQKKWLKSIKFYKKEIDLNQSPHIYFNTAISYSYVDKRKATEFYWKYLGKVKEKLEKDIIQNKNKYLRAEQKNIDYAFKNLKGFYRKNISRLEKLEKLRREINQFREK